MNVHDNTYLDLMAKIWTEGEIRGDRTGIGTRSLFGEQIKFDLRQGFPLLTSKRVHFPSIVVELLWFLQGRTDNQWLVERGCTIWNEWATAEQTARFGRQEGDLGPVYGHQWRNFGGDLVLAGTDQITGLIKSLRENPFSRRHIVSAWNPVEADRVALPPCHTLFQCYVHNDGTLDLHMYQRSADSFLGLPFNTASYALLVHLLARETGLEPGTLTISFGDVHLYLNHAEQVHLQLGRRVGGNLPDSPTLQIATTGRGLFDLEPPDVHVVGYNPMPGIKAPVAV